MWSMSNFDVLLIFDQVFDTFSNSCFILSEKLMEFVLDIWIIFLVHDVQPYQSEDFNMTHSINILSFGRSIEWKANPLDGYRMSAEKGEQVQQNKFLIPLVYYNL